MNFSIYKLKSTFICLLRPVASRLYTKKFTANHITILATALSILYGTILSVFSSSAILWFALPIFLFVRMALNAIDGILAREYNLKSRLGGILNECGDVVSDAALFIPLAFVSGVSVVLTAIFIWLALATEFAGILGLLIGSSRCYDGPMGKSDRAFCVGLGALFIGYGYLHGLELHNYINIGLGGCSVLMLLTSYNRLKTALNTPLV